MQRSALEIAAVGMTFVLSYGCTAIADLGQYNAGDSSASSSGGSGASGGGGAGGGGGEGACAKTTAYSLDTRSLASVVDACTTPGNTQILENTDETEVGSPFEPQFPFDFCFYGEQASNFWVGDNGYVTFGATAPDALQLDGGEPGALSDVTRTRPRPGVSAFWERLQVGSDGVCAVVTDAAPNRTLWFTWKNVCFEGEPAGCVGAPSRLTFSVGIEEGTGRIIIGFVEMVGSERAQGQQATIGIAAAVAPGCDADECDSDGECADGTPCGYTQYSSQQITVLDTLELSPR